ncbi:MAG: MBL fold metallo-hydrolase [Saprospiraceae bacterium]|nr:MBL fold metallo-hydrolase [Saprospiraceae bacterium]
MQLSLLIWTGFFQLDAQSIDSLSMTYLGTAGWIVEDQETTILIDPYISRLKLGRGPSISPNDVRRIYSRTDYFESDTALINSIISKADYILVHHSHFDHLSDVPYIAKKTGAKVIGSETTCRILAAYGIPEEKLFRIKGGEDYQFEHFSVRVVPSLHSALNQKLYFDARVLPDTLRAPLKISEFIEGGSFMYFLRLSSHKILTMGSMNFIEREIAGLKPDILCAGVNFSRNEIFKYTERLMKLTHYPKWVVPVHWDNFRIPYGYSQDRALELKVGPFIEEVKYASPTSKVVVPTHLEEIIFRN